MVKKSRPSARKKDTAAPSGSIGRQEAIDRAEAMIQAGKPDMAIELLLPLAERHKRDGNLQYYLGYAYVKAGQMWEGVPYYKKALEITRDPGLWLPLGYLYLDLDLRVLAHNALRQALRHSISLTAAPELEHDFALLEEDMREMAEFMKLPKRVVEEGLQYMEEGQIALQSGEFLNCINLNRRAIRLLGSFPPPHNNLSLALFFNGHPQEAIRTAQGVLEIHPKNIHAIANLIRYLAWTGQIAQARAYWEELSRQSPEDETLRFKMVEAAALIEDDQMVYELGKGFKPANLGDHELANRTEFYLAVSEANLGMHSAKRRLGKVKDDFSWAEDILNALKGGKTGLGWSQRFPYHHFSELIPRREYERFIQMFLDEERVNPKRLRNEVRRWVERFPQVVLMGQKIILEEQQPDVGIQLLEAAGTPEAFAVLREIGLGQQGSDEARMDALNTLLEAEQFQPGETVRFWKNGEWIDIQLLRIDIVEDEERLYSPQVIKLINQGLAAYQKGKSTEAEELYERVLALEPNAREAYNNLGTIYVQKGEKERAQELFEKALEIDPLYVLARCNLASFALDDKDVDKAEAFVAPLEKVYRLDAKAFAFLSYTRARIAFLRNENELSINLLKGALEIVLDYEPASKLLEHLELIQNLRSGLDGYLERMHKRDLSARQKLQKKISTADPTLAEAMSIYTREAMTGMARVINPWGGWSALKKAELYGHLLEFLMDPDIIRRLANDLSDAERRALRMVLEHEGFISWQAFGEQFGDDLEDSPYWQYHQPETVMGRLRVRGLLVESMVNDELILAIPVELREPLRELV